MKLSGGKFYYEIEVVEIDAVAQFGWFTDGFEVYVYGCMFVYPLLNSVCMLCVMYKGLITIDILTYSLSYSVGLYLGC